MQVIKLKVASVQTHLKQLGFEPFEIYSSLAPLDKGCAGKAFPQQNSIVISYDYYNSEHRQEVIERTVPHEVVHLYVAKYFPEAPLMHGKEFKKLMRQLGCDDSTYHSMKLEGMQRRKNIVLRFVYVTPSGKEVHLTRQKHAKALEGTATFTFEGEKLSYTNKQIRI